MKRLFLLALCVLLVGRASPARAQDTSDVAFRVRMPDSVVVTASRRAAPARTTGRRVTVYTQEDIQSLAVNSIDQLLDVVAGLDVQSRGGFGVQSDLKLRGSTFNGVLLLLDGARLNDPYTGHFLMDLPVPLSAIARVEVLRGPATALYGPDALGGVVHLITKTGLRQDPGTGTGLAAQVEGRYGTKARHDVGGRVRHAVRTDVNRRVATAAVTHDVEGATLYARAGVDDREFGAYHFYTDFPSDRAREATSTFWLQSRLSSSGATDTPWQVQVFGKQHRDRYTYNPTLSSNRHVSRRFRVQGQAAHSWGAWCVTGGASGGLRGVDSNRDGLHSDASAGAFVRLRWAATPRLTVNQSTRVDYDPVYGVEPTPQLYLAYDLGGATLRAGGGRVVRAPNYVERFIDSPTNQGTPTLDAETAWAGEVGADVRLPAGLALHLTGFGRTTRNPIDYRRRDGVFVAQNLRRTETLGLETEATFDRTVGALGVHLDAAYTLLDATLDATAPASAYKYGRNSPRHLVQGSALVDAGPVTVGVQGTWQDRLDDPRLATDRYGVLHARLAYETRLAGTRLTLSGELRNAFDRQYSEVFDAPMPGRTLLVGAELRL
ncbi:MAG: TonB-dependent receptor [Bacteroidetes bacterium QH_2_63_10]|nr:MAG: TonB-dependent receptor [Bacteroidetes bacterium QH_2_63_10]